MTPSLTRKSVALLNRSAAWRRWSGLATVACALSAVPAFADQPYDCIQRQPTDGYSFTPAQGSTVTPTAAQLRASMDLIGKHVAAVESLPPSIRRQETNVPGAPTPSLIASSTTRASR